jgi:hypothetical protein
VFLRISSTGFYDQLTASVLFDRRMQFDIAFGFGLMCVRTHTSLTKTNSDKIMKKTHKKERKVGCFV